jgi:hypothetical protein
VFAAIMERRPEALPEIKAAVARNIAAELGDRPVRCRLRAHVLSARRREARHGLSPSPSSSATS